MPPKRVALLIETSSSWGQQIIAGVGDYVRRNGRWILYLDHRGTYEKQLVPQGWAGDGIIARVTSPDLAEQLRATGLPCVNVSSIRVPEAVVQHVGVSETRVGEIAAETLLRVGLQHFGYVGPPPRPFYHDAISAAFTRGLAAAGRVASTLNAERMLRAEPHSPVDFQPLVDWLESLPKPAGVLCWNALGARHVAEACCWRNIRVPEDVSIIGGLYDQLTADIALPQLTCVDQAPRQLGIVAAGELDRLMSGGRVEDPVIIQPNGLVQRDSVLAPSVRDPIVDEAVRMIGEHATGPFDIARLLETVPISRRGLEQRFQRVLGHGPSAELRRVRLQEAQRLLAETNLPVKQVAWLSGLKSPHVLQRLLRETTSLSPSQYRQAHRQQSVDRGERGGD